MGHLLNFSRVLQAERQQERDSRQEAEKLQGLGKVLKKTGRRTSSGKALGRPQGSKAKPKSTPNANKAPKKLQKGILGQYGKVKKVINLKYFFQLLLFCY